MSICGTRSTQVRRHGDRRQRSIKFKAGGGDEIHAYVARPEGNGPFPGIVSSTTCQAGTSSTCEFARRLAKHGYIAISPDLYCRQGHGTPDDVAAKVRADGGVSDDQVVGDCAAARDWLKAQPTATASSASSAPARAAGTRSLVASKSTGCDAVVDLWGGGVVMDQTTEKQPVAPIDMTKDLIGPLLGPLWQRRSAPIAGAGEPARGSAQGRRQDSTSSIATMAPATASSTTRAAVPSAAGDGRLGKGVRVL